MRCYVIKSWGFKAFLVKVILFNILAGVIFSFDRTFIKIKISHFLRLFGFKMRAIF